MKDAPVTPDRLFTRVPDNPVLEGSSWPYPVNSVFNPAAVHPLLDDGTLSDTGCVLLARAEGYDGHSHLAAAWSHDGIGGWRPAAAPAIEQTEDDVDEAFYGLEDPRAVWVEEADRYAVTYTSFTEDGPRVALAWTRDFETFDRVGVQFACEDKNAALFPRRIGGRWAILGRPSGDHRPAITVRFADDLLDAEVGRPASWSPAETVMEARVGAWWDALRIGTGAPPVETDEGWLLVYHGVRDASSGGLYRVGLALLDLDDPTKVVRRSRSWVLGPRAPYERTGDVNNVVFPCGCLYDGPSGEMRLYYGAADTSVAIATAPASDVLSFLLSDGEG